MSVATVTELSASSGEIESGDIVGYEVDLEVTFVVE